MRKAEQDKRYAQANKEAWLSLGVYGLYFVWWYVCAYGMGSGDPAQYSYVFGLPAWFFYSCLVGYPLITVLLWAVVRFGFKNMPLDDEERGDSGENGDEKRGDGGADKGRGGAA